MARLTYQSHARILSLLFALLWLGLAIQPKYRADWMLENALLISVSFILYWGYRHHLFSRLSHTCIFLFLCLHAVGAHYTYAEVPYNAWWQSLTGHPFNEMFGWERNHFDRLVHFLYGLLWAYPIRELFLRVAQVKGFWAYFLPLEFTLATSAFFELIEWAAAEVFGGELGQAYLGTQGDVWDAHKDMALAGLGAVITILITAFVNHRSQRDFAQEWSDSFRVTQPRANKRSRRSQGSR